MKVEVGEMPCTNEDCGSHAKNRPVTIFLNTETGGLNFMCDKCRAKQYALVGEDVRESWIRRYCKDSEEHIRAAEKRSGKVVQKQAPTPTPKAVATQAPAPAPENKPKRASVLDSIC